MKTILHFISGNINWIIVMFGLALIALLILNWMKLNYQKERIKEAVQRKNFKYFYGQGGAVEEEEDKDASVTPDTIRQYESEFNNVVAWHDIISQVIPIFPLLGILGTVAGLMLSLSQGNNFDALRSSLDVALSSTLYALIFAILLKSLDAGLSTKAIIDTENLLEDYNKKRDLAEMLNQQKMMFENLRD